ncbi:MAG: ABC transporter substrate-binding protein [Pseudoclavibacter sp.]
MEVTRAPGRRALAPVALAATGALVLTGCAGGAGSPSTSTSVLSVAASAAITTWDPVRSFSTEALYLGNIYEPLLWKNPDGSPEEFTPAIAESWSTSDDGLIWTFDIREGVTFHDGETVDAEAVKTSIEAAKENGGASFIWAPVESIEATDASTIEMHLSYPAPMDLVAASTYGAWIVSPKALEAAATDETYFEAGVSAGTGPYTIGSYVPGDEVVLEAHEEYWNTEAAPHYDVVDISITPDAVTAQQMLTAGEVDLATNIPLENVGSVADQIGAEVRESASPFNFLAFFNTQRPPLDNPTVRQALSYAIPYDDIIDVGGQGYGTQSYGPVPAGVFPASDSIPQYTYDLEKARELLAEAGYPDGGIDLTLSYSSENSSEARFVPLIKDSFAQIGVEVTVQAELFNQQWENGKADPATAQDIFVLYYWPTYSDAGSDNLYSLFHSSDTPSFNLSYWDNPEYDTLIDDAATLTGTDRAAAQVKYEEAMTLLVDQAPGAFLYDPSAVLLVPPGIDVGEYNMNYPFTTFFAPIKPAA